jgi:DNA-binding NarL/FixJ family response regulator
VRKNTDELKARIETFFGEEKFLDNMPMYQHNTVEDFSQFVSEKVLWFKTYALQKNIGLTSSVEPGIYIVADRSSLNSIVNNLVENAIKYTPASGSIQVALAAGADTIRFSVHDTGCGIPAGLQKKIFDPYVRANPGSNNPGMGMGLSIASNCVKSLAGTITVHSQENQGSGFVVELPRYKGPITGTSIRYTPTNAPAGKPADAIGHNDKPYVMVVEDNTDMLLYLRDMLKPDYNVYVAGSATEALDKIKTIPILHLVVSDILMDGMDGIQLLKTVSQNPLYCHVPFLFLTASTTQQNIQTSYELGAVDYIQKPMDIAVLLIKVKAIIGNNKNRLTILAKDVSDYIINKNSKLYNTLENRSDTEQKEDRFEASCAHYGITGRQKEIILMLETGLSQKEIAHKLSISEKTVNKHNENIFNRTGARNRTEMLRKLFGE